MMGTPAVPGEHGSFPEGPFPTPPPCLNWIVTRGGNTAHPANASQQRRAPRTRSLLFSDDELCSKSPPPPNGDRYEPNCGAVSAADAAFLAILGLVAGGSAEHAFGHDRLLGQSCNDERRRLHVLRWRYMTGLLAP